MTEDTLVKRIISSAAIMLLILGAACTREKPPSSEPAPSLGVQGLTPAAVVTSDVSVATSPLTSTVPTLLPLDTPIGALSTPVLPTFIPPTVVTGIYATPVPGGSVATTTYTVQWGDWLSRIATRHGVTSQAILAANPGLDPNKIYPGTVINIPAPGAAAATPTVGMGVMPSGPTTYTVQRGDWWTAIARKFGVTLQALQDANPGVSPSVVYPGQVLNIPPGGKPESSPTPGGGTKTNYTVQPGDTLFTIAVRFGKTIYDLQSANHLADTNAIYPGQTLIIP